MTPAKRVYTCTVCGKQGFMDENWSFYGSLIHEEACPRDLIYCCSEDCQKEATKKINSKKWLLPLIDKHGDVVRERKGY